VSGDENAAGARIARARRRRGLSQSVLAGLVGRSESWLSHVERGKRGVDSHAVLTRMAEVLRVEVEELTGPGGGDGEEGQRVYEPAAEIERAMMGYEAVSASIGGREPGARATAAHLRARASAAYAGYQATRYDDTGRILPALIREAEAAGGDDQEACSVRAMVYDTTAALLHRVGETSLAWTAADRALAAAEQSGRPELTAVQAYRLTYVLAGRKHRLRHWSWRCRRPPGWSG
jgi:transcriptional regulator with XRE-family HTH domain